MSFGEDLKRIVERTKAKTSEVVRKSAIDMQSSMASMAPVDTGRLRANFQCGLGAIDKSTSDAPGSDAVARTRGALAEWKPGQTIYLTNSLPYAHVAEYGLYGKPPGSANGPKTVNGFSSQAVGGFVRLTVQRFEQFVHKSAQDVK